MIKQILSTGCLLDLFGPCNGHLLTSPRGFLFFLRLASLTRDDWAASGDTLRQVGTGDEHPPGMAAACPPFSSLPLVRAPRVLGDVFFVICCSASVPPYEFNIIYAVQLGSVWLVSLANLAV
jgi:hypothetical protein